MATYWENRCSFGSRYVSWYKYLIVSLVFSHLGFWSGGLFLFAPFPDLCLLVCCLVVGADVPLGSIYFQNHWYSGLLPISRKSFHLNDILTVFPIQMHGRPMLTLLKNRSRSSQGHDLYTHCSAWVIDVSSIVPRQYFCCGSICFMFWIEFLCCLILLYVLIILVKFG